MPQRPSFYPALVERLSAEHQGADRADVVAAVHAAAEAVRLFGGHEADLADLAGRLAERDLRLRLGLDREAVRLDPERRSRRR